MARESKAADAVIDPDRKVCTSRHLSGRKSATGRSACWLRCATSAPTDRSVRKVPSSA